MIKTKIEDAELLEHLASLEDDRREIFLIADGEVRVSAVGTTRTVNEMKANHRTGPLETYILGQGYTAGALLSGEVKGNDRILLSIECGGPVRGMTVEAWACGAVRGYLTENPIPLEKPLETLDTSQIFGPGFLTVTKILEGSRTPFSGQIMLEYGHLAQDLALYYTKSEQTPSLFSLSLYFDKSGRVWGAGGIMMQAMPDCSREVLSSLQEKSSELTGMGRLISEGLSVRDYVTQEFSSWGIDRLGHTPVGFSCPCSRKNFEKYLVNLPQKEKDGILEGNFPLVLQCFNCGTEYEFPKEQLEELFHKEK